MTQTPSGGLRSLVGASVAFLTGGVASKALSLLTVPILARILSPAELGLLDIGAAVAATVTTLAVFGSDNAVARFLPEDVRSGAVWGAAAVVVAATTVVLALLVLAAQVPLAGLLVGSGDHSDVVVAALVHGVATAIFVSGLNVLRLTRPVRWYAVATTATIVAQSIGGVVVAALIGNPIVGILVWWGLVALVGGATVLLLARPPMERPDRDRVVRLIRFGGPLVPGVLAWTIGDLGIRASLAHADLAALGSYGIATRLVSVVALLISGFSIAWMPYVVGSARRADDKAFRDGATAVMAVVGLVAIALAALGPELVLLIGGERYRSAGAAIAPLAAGMVAFAVLSVLIGAAAVQLKTATLAWAGLLGMGAQVVLAGLLVGPLLLVGAAVASAIGYGIAAVTVALRLQLRGLIDRRVVGITAGTFLALAIAWLMEFARVPLAVRALALLAVLAVTLAAYGRPVLAAWSR